MFFEKVEFKIITSGISNSHYTHVMLNLYMMYICMLIHITFFMNIQWCYETWTHIASGYTRIKFKFWIWKGAEIHRLRLSQPLKWSQNAQYYYMTYQWPKQNETTFNLGYIEDLIYKCKF